MAQPVVGGPLRERDLRDEARLDPMRVADARRVLRGRGRDFVLREPVAQLDAELRREAGSDFAGVVHGAVGADVPEVQGSDLAHGGGREGVSDHRQFLSFQRLHLDPLFRAAPLVHRRQTLPDDPLPPLGRRAVQRVGSRHVERLRRLDSRRCTPEELLENRAPFGVRLPPQVFAVHPQDVEDDHLFAIGTALQELEPRHSLLILGDDLAVEDDVRHFELRHRLRDLREARHEIELVAAPDRHLSVRDRRQGAEAVVLQFVRPVLSVRRRLGDERGEHRREEVPEELLWCARHRH